MVLQTLNKKGALPDDLKSLEDDMQILDNILAKLREDPNFDEIKVSLDQINNSLKQAQVAYKNKQIEKAKILLKKSAIYTKILIESPLMKMTQAEIDMDQAALRVGSKDYVAAGSFINEALDHLQGIQIQGMTNSINNSLKSKTNWWYCISRRCWENTRMIKIAALFGKI